MPGLQLSEHDARVQEWLDRIERSKAHREARRGARRRRSGGSDARAS